MAKFKIQICGSCEVPANKPNPKCDDHRISHVLSAQATVRALRPRVAKLVADRRMKERRA